MAKDKKNLMDWDDLKDNTKQRYKSSLVRLERSRLTIAQLGKMKDSEVATSLNISESQVKNERRIWAQLKGNRERREKTIELALKDYKGVGKELVKKNLTKTIGNTFEQISNEILEHIQQTSNPNYTKEDSDELTEIVLLIPPDDRKELEDKEIERILDFYSPK